MTSWPQPPSRRAGHGCKVRAAGSKHHPLAGGGGSSPKGAAGFGHLGGALKKKLRIRHEEVGGLGVGSRSVKGGDGGGDGGAATAMAAALKMELEEKGDLGRSMRNV